MSTMGRSVANNGQKLINVVKERGVVGGSKSFQTNAQQAAPLCLAQWASFFNIKKSLIVILRIFIS